jgi:hypothetical protein
MALTLLSSEKTAQSQVSPKELSLAPFESFVGEVQQLKRSK